MYNVRFPLLQDKVSQLSQKVRISLAIILGATIVVLTSSGYAKTGADIFVAEMFHAIANTLAITFLLISVYTRGWPLAILTKINGLLLFLVGVTVMLKAFNTFGDIALQGAIGLRNVETLLFTGTLVAILSLLQMLLVWDERRLLLGEKNTFPDSIPSKQKRSVVVADSMQVFASPSEYIIITMFSLPPLAGRYVDFLFTLWMMLWLFRRGTYIFAPIEKRRG